MNKLTAYAKLMRPHQYIKNGFIWLPLLFANQMTNIAAIIPAAIAFGAFCLMASAIYVLNDIRDVADDRNHPVKKKRPIASGRVYIKEALFLFLVLITASLALSGLWLPRPVLFIMIAYFLLNVSYSLYLKHLPIIDIICISLGFVMRIFVGGQAAEIPISPWIVIMTFLLALFLALAKRKDDLLLLNQGHQVRKAIDGYNADFISLAMGVMASVTIVAYILYTVSPAVIALHGEYMYITGFWVVCGLLRYLQITFVDQKSGSPTLVFLKDRMLQAIVLLWLLNAYALLRWRTL
ncbi:MAG: decaprenyl-phosphate phosphoribosyltransferase [Desulfobacteraceae bacterium]|nr:decaprenyl-phosphate phosphoribosyltransferase [Desulfobacteraceae bacterium]